ncbi:MAG TPA: iron chelate uptake ABC transporter family permease subunit [Mycobacteriales bacterium]|nr:iron chelate uptake ABC transporter family permease subunit [Mycobacteriales bacterium]
MPVRTDLTPSAADSPATRDGGGARTAGALGRRNAVRATGLAIAVVTLLLVMLASIAIGARTVAPHTIFDALFHYNGSYDQIVVRDLRLPRTLIGATVGAALGLAGAVMQALTRNPLADPGLLGVNSGAAAAVVLAIGVLHLSSVTSYVWFAFVGAALAAVAVYLLGSRGRAGATPVRLALAGTAVAAALSAFTSAMVLIDPKTFDQFRFWAVGSLSGRGMTVLAQVAPFVVVGVLLALLSARALNAIALGDDAGRALGAHIGRTRALGALAVTLLCGAATAAVGPIGFVGLTVPHVARAITGPDQRWVLPYSLVLAPILLLGSDIIGRIVLRPSELQVGIVTAFVGAPVFITLVRRRRVAQL